MSVVYNVVTTLRTFQETLIVLVYYRHFRRLTKPSLGLFLYCFVLDSNHFWRGDFKPSSATGQSKSISLTLRNKIMAGKG